MFVIQDLRTRLYKQKKKHFGPMPWTKSIYKAQLFKTRSAAKCSMYGFSINPNRRKLKAKIILPDWVNIIKIDILIQKV